MSIAELPIQIDREQIARFCRERGIRKFWRVLNVEAGKLKETVLAILAKEFPQAPLR